MTGTQQRTLDGEAATTPRERPDTFVVCTETGECILRSRRHDWPHETMAYADWVEQADVDDHSDPYEHFDADETIGWYFDVTLEYSVSYRFRVPACSETRAKEIAEEWHYDATPCDSHHLHTNTREMKAIERQAVPADWDPYSGERIYDALAGADEDGDAE